MEKASGFNFLNSLNLLWIHNINPAIYLHPYCLLSYLIISSSYISYISYVTYHVYNKSIFTYIFNYCVHISSLHCVAIASAIPWYVLNLSFHLSGEGGKRVVKVNPAYTSQTCSQCGNRHKLKLSDRMFHCPVCNLELSRDHNAAINIRALGLQSLGVSVKAPCFS